jgi:hypothetical protein
MVSDLLPHAPPVVLVLVQSCNRARARFRAIVIVLVLDL